MIPFGRNWASRIRCLLMTSRPNIVGSRLACLGSLRLGLGLWSEPCEHKDEHGVERGVSMQVWLVASGAATLLFVLAGVGLVLQSCLATLGFASAAASARDVRSEFENGTATVETARRHTWRAGVSDAVSQVTGTAYSVTTLFCFFPLALFSLTWFVLGNYWFWWLVREDSCNQMVYNVCWWTIVYTYAMLVLGCVAGPGLDPAQDAGYENIRSDSDGDGEKLGKES